MLKGLLSERYGTVLTAKLTGVKKIRKKYTKIKNDIDIKTFMQKNKSLVFIVHIHTKNSVTFLRVIVTR